MPETALPPALGKEIASFGIAPYVRDAFPRASFKETLMSHKQTPISVAQADEFISTNLLTPRTHRFPLDRACGHVLAEDLFADRPFPPFDRVAMDGVAIRFADFQAGNRRFPVRGIQAAGAPSQALPSGSCCLEVMTGAVLPETADCVIPVEDISREGDEILIPELFHLKLWQHVHREGVDRPSGECVLPKGTVLGPAAIATAATIGAITPLVIQTPRVSFFSTGDELVPIDQEPLPHQIRRSNAEAILAALHLSGFHHCQAIHLQDDQDSMESKLRAALSDNDVLIMSGGVSMGRFDFVPDVLKALGFNLLFHKVKQRPGKPMLFGKLLWKGQEKLVFALPGNPVSSLTTFHRYVMPALRRMMGFVESPIQVRLLEAFHFAKPLVYFLPVKLIQDEQGRHCAQPLPTGGSGDFSSLIHTDGFVEIPMNKTTIPQDSALTFYSWSGMQASTLQGGRE